MPGITAAHRWAGLRVLLAGLWLVAAVTAWWVEPRPATYERASAEVVAQRVTAADLTNPCPDASD